MLNAMLTEENSSATNSSAPEPERSPVNLADAYWAFKHPVISQYRLNAVAAAVLRLEDEQVLAAIKELLDQAASPDKAPLKPLLPPGYAADNGFWMADDFDEPLEDMLPYMF